LLGLWGLTLIGLPLTSFPLITKLTGATVAPFSAIPLAILAVIWLIPFVVRGGKLPKEVAPFVIFTLFVIALAAFAFFQDVGTFRNRSLLGQTVRTFIPFGIGLTFFLITSAWHLNELVLRRSLQFIYIGGGLLLVFSMSQAGFIFLLHRPYPDVLNEIMGVLVTQSYMVGNPRLAGLTWEPSWFAHQLNMLYLPLWLAATYQRTSVFPKIWKISLENVFLILGMAVFFLSSPRIGGVAFMLMLFYLFLRLNTTVYRVVIRRLSGLWSAVKRPGLLRFGVGTLVVLAFIGIYLAFSAVIIKVASERDWRLGLIVNSPLSQDEIRQISAFDENSLFYLGIRFAFLERTVYWMDGWHIFNDFPILGVGLGNAGFYFMSHLPAVGWSSIEVRAVAYLNDSLPNIKSIWYRLLAETGIVGFSLFVGWLLVLWYSTGASLRSQNNTIKTVALAGRLAILAFIMEGFSIDTFGLPYLFVITGLAASAGMIYRIQNTSRI